MNNSIDPEANLSPKARSILEKECPYWIQYGTMIITMILLIISVITYVWGGKWFVLI